MIQLSGAGKRFGHKLLFENLQLADHAAGQRTGLVGANGTGKSTLLKILAGIEDARLRHHHPHQRHHASATCRRTASSLSGRTVFAECMSVFDDLRAMERELEDADPRAWPNSIHASAEYAADPPTASIASQSEFPHRDGYAIEAQVGTVLAGLGFRKEDWTRQTEEFSGGWQMRIALAKLLLQKPNLLLLDEPTNHLDLEARNWLEDYLGNYPNAFVLISHDRYFLDVTVNKIVEIWNKRVHFYTGNYDKYLRKKQSAADTLSSRLQQSARPHRATRSLHQPLPLPGHQGQAGAEPHQGTRKDRAHRGPAGREAPSTSPSRSPSPAAASSPSSKTSRKSYGEKQRLRRRQLSPSSAATASPWSASTAPANPP